MSTADGSDVAYAVVGSGRPLVYVGGWLSHLEHSWALPEERSFLESLGQGMRLVRYDRVGCGLSGPLPGKPSLAGELAQLDAVIGTLDGEPLDLVGASLGAPVALAWAAAHPERVRRLVLYGGWASGSELSTPAGREHMLGLIAAHWGLGSDLLTEVFAPDSPTGLRRHYARYQRASSSAETARALLALSYDLDVRELLGGVRTPTLVVHRAGDRAAPVAQAEALAAGIADAMLTILPGGSHLPFAGDAEELVATIRRFLGLRPVRGGSRGLTPRQQEVAALVAEGLTNRAIAERLGIEERSAEGHLERIRARLGLRSRAELAAWVAARR